MALGCPSKILLSGRQSETVVFVPERKVDHELFFFFLIQTAANTMDLAGSFRAALLGEGAFWAIFLACWCLNPFAPPGGPKPVGPARIRRRGWNRARTTHH